jgi:CSLREA domain-containing protein
MLLAGISVSNRVLRKVLAFTLLGVMATFGWLSASRTAEGVGVIIVVTTTADNETFDGACSFREAIIASNTGSAGDCTGTTDVDSIRFTGLAANSVIELNNELPAISARVNINGSVSGGGRVEIRPAAVSPPGTENGIKIGNGNGAANLSTIRNVALDGFRRTHPSNPTTGQAILIADDYVAVRSSYIGTNAAGTAGGMNHTGIQITGNYARVGDVNGLTPGGACTGDCNLISNNEAAGIDIQAAPGAAIDGNFIGTNLAGTVALPNQFGIMTDSPASIGAGAGNLISGNLGDGIIVDNAYGMVISNNKVGTDTTGTLPLPNLFTGISLYDANSSTVGGVGAGNIVSGNGMRGILIAGSDFVVVTANIVGPQADGVTPLSSNPQSGVSFAGAH